MENQNPGQNVTKSVEITINIKIARMMLTVAGFRQEFINSATDDEIFEKVLSLIDCYGATYQIKAI